MARASQYTVSSDEEITYRPSYETSDITMTMTYEVASNTSVPLFIQNGTIQRRTISMHEDNFKQEVDESFLIACKTADDCLLENIIDYIPTVNTINQQDQSGRTGLNHVCMQGTLKMAEMLVELTGLDVNLADNEGNTPLMMAAQGGHEEIVNLLLEKFADTILIDQRNAFGMTALMKAALQGKTKCVKSLLEAGANPYLCDPRRNYCALQWAKFCCRYSCADAIEKHMKSNSKTYLQHKLFPSNNKWNSDPELNGTTESRSKTGGERSWLKKKLRKTFRHVDQHKARRSSSEFGIFGNITTATVMCASSAVLQNTDCTITQEDGKKGIIIPKLEVLNLMEEHDSHRHS